MENVEFRKPMSVSSAALLNFASQMAVLVLATITAVLVARLLGPSGKGIVTIITLSGALLVTFGGLGVPMYHGCIAGRGEYSTTALRTNALVCAVIGSLFLAGVAVIAWITQVWLMPAEPTDWPLIGRLRQSVSAVGMKLVWLAAVLPAGLLIRNLAGIFQGQGRFREYNALTLVMWTVIPLCTAAFVLGFGGVNAALGAWWLGYVTAAGLGLWLTRSAGVGVPHRPLLGASMRFGLAVWCVQLVGEANFRFDTYVAALVGGASGAGYYSVAVSVTNLLFHVPAAIGTSVLPRMATLPGEEAARVAGMGCRISFWSSALFAVVVMLLARPLIQLLFGPAFEPAVTPLRWLLPGIVVYSMAHVTTSYFYGHSGRPMLNGLVALVSLLVGLITSAALAPRYGLAGVAGAVTIGRCIAMIVNLWLFHRLSRCSLAEVLLPRRGDVSVILAPVRRIWPMMQRVRAL